MEQARGALGPGPVWLQQSTVGVEGSERLAALAAELGVTYVDAPGARHQEAGAGRRPRRAGLRPRGRAPAGRPGARRDRQQDPLGRRGRGGSRLKLAANAWVFTVVEGIAESLTLTRELGLDPALFLESVQGGALDAPYVQLKGKAMLDCQLRPGVRALGRPQDADRSSPPRPAPPRPRRLPGIREHFQRAVDAGHGDKDMSATYLRALTGVPEFTRRSCAFSAGGDVARRGSGATSPLRTYHPHARPPHRLVAAAALLGAAAGGVTTASADPAGTSARPGTATATSPRRSCGPTWNTAWRRSTVSTSTSPRSHRGPGPGRSASSSRWWRSSSRPTSTRRRSMATTAPPAGASDTCS